MRALEAGCDVDRREAADDRRRGAARIDDGGRAHRPGRSPSTFNYRYAPRNSALRQVHRRTARSATSPPSHFEWLLDTMHGADYFRRWHREKEQLRRPARAQVHPPLRPRQLVDRATPRARVFASGGLRFYGADNAAGTRPRRPARAGHAGGAHDPFALDLPPTTRLTALYLDAEHARRLPARPRRVRRGHHDRGQPRARRRLRVRRHAQLLAQRARARGRATASRSTARAGARRARGRRARARAAAGPARRCSTRAPSTPAPPARCARRASGCSCSGTGRRRRGPDRDGEGGHGGGDALLLDDVFAAPATTRSAGGRTRRRPAEPRRRPGGERVAADGGSVILTSSV